MNIEETLQFIHSVSWMGSKPGLERTRELLRRLGNPEKKCRYIHVAGTNGKGSTASMIASVLTQAGYKTGLYTSPYLWRFNERMQINGVPISDAELCQITARVAPHAKAMADSPTEFELVCAIGFEYFAGQSCDYVVLEVGMGGRLDATNVIERPECAVLTNIGLDHTKELGDTLEKIAAEKAGIVKSGCTVVAYEQTSGVMQVFENAAVQCGATCRRADFSALRSEQDSREGQTFSYKHYEHLHLPLLGAHQLKNAAVALETVFALRERGAQISDEALRSGLGSTVWPARFEIVSRKPWFVVDGGHNPQCAETVADNLVRYFPDMRRVIMLGVLADKDVSGLTDILDPAADEYVTATPDSPRAMSAAELAELLKKYGKPVTACGSIAEAVETAKQRAGSDGMACCVGSLYMAGEARERGKEE